VHEIAESFSDIASFVMVYIEEAHATDVWPLGTKVCVNQHKTIEERIEVAKKYLVEERKCKIPVFVDTMENDFDNQFHAWPERFFILEGSCVELVGTPSNDDKGFNRNDIVDWLTEYRENLSRSVKIEDVKIEDVNKEMVVCKISS